MSTERTIPHDAQAERAVIGAILLAGNNGDAAGLAKVMADIRPDDFYTDGLGYIFAELRKCYAAGTAIDVIPVVARLRDAGIYEKVGGAAAIAECAKAVTTSAHLPHYADIVSRYSRQRKVIGALADALQEAYRAAGDDAMLKVAQMARNIATSAEGQFSRFGAVRRMAELLGEAYESVVESEGAGVTLGLPSLDAAIGGVEYGELVIFAARPSHGKTLAALQCAHHWTEKGIPTLIISEEMTALQLALRTASFATKVERKSWATHGGQVLRELGNYSEKRCDLWVAKPCTTVEAVASQVAHAVKNLGVRCVIVDYVQLLTAEGSSRYEQITKVSNTLKRLATEHNIVMLCLAQLNREIENRATFEPRSSDLRDTGSLEQDADVIVGLVWPHRADPTAVDPETKEKLPADEYQFFVLKNRNREITADVVDCKIIPRRQKLVPTNYAPEFDQDDF